jgi:hypothetical protein
MHLATPQGGVTTDIRILRHFSKGGDDRSEIEPATLEIRVGQEEILAVDEILTFASVHGNFVCISDRILHQFEVVLDRHSRLEVLQDALLQVAFLERGNSRAPGVVPYAIEDLIDALERIRQGILEGRETGAIQSEIAQGLYGNG